MTTGPALASQPRALVVSPGGVFASVAAAISAAPAGSTILVRAGTYPGFDVKKPLTIQAYPGETPVISDGVRANVIYIGATSDVVIRGLTIQDAPNQWGAGIRVEGSTRVTLESNRLQFNRSFGAKANNSTYITLRDNDVTRNETGFEFSGGGEGDLVENNRIFDHRLMVVDVGDPLRPGSGDRGANGMVFHKTTGHIVVRGNRLWGNRAVSTQFGTDGGSFEIYAASNIDLYNNTMWDSQNVVETGTDGTPCDAIRFTHNVAWGSTGEAFVPGPSHGLILRCASNSLVAHNTLFGYDSFGVYVTDAGSFAGGVANLVVANNIFDSDRAQAYSIGALGSPVSLDYNLAFRPGGGNIAWVKDKGSTSSLATYRGWTGFEAHGLQADPLFADGRLGGDFRLQASSPAIDAGVAGYVGSWCGSAPDIGRYEHC